MATLSLSHCTSCRQRFANSLGKISMTSMPRPLSAAVSFCKVILSPRFLRLRTSGTLRFQRKSLIPALLPPAPRTPTPKGTAVRAASAASLGATGSAQRPRSSGATLPQVARPRQVGERRRQTTGKSTA